MLQMSTYKKRNMYFHVTYMFEGATYMFEGATYTLRCSDNAGLFAPSKTGTPLAPYFAHL
jgi:hypothetical protein